MKPVAEEIAELRAMTGGELVERYVQLFERQPRCKHPAWLLPRCAWRVQELRFGGLSDAAKARLEALIAEIDFPIDSVRGRATAPPSGTPGTTVSRVWRGREVRATSIEGGRWEHDGAVYRSLSAVAKHVTGSHWNGKLFFGLTRRAE